MEIFGVSVATVLTWIIGITHCVMFMLIIDPTVRQGTFYVWRTLCTKLR